MWLIGGMFCRGGDKMGDGGYGLCCVGCVGCAGQVAVEWCRGCDEIL